MSVFAGSQEFLRNMPHVKYAIDKGESKTISGKQEYYENIINRFI